MGSQLARAAEPPSYAELDDFFAANCPALPLHSEVEAEVRRAESLAVKVEAAVRRLQGQERRLFRRITDSKSPEGGPRDLEDYARLERVYREYRAVQDATARLEAAGRGRR